MESKVKTKKPAVESTAVERIEIPAMKLRTINVKLKGTTPLIMHQWSEKAKKMMRDKQSGVATTKKEKRDPLQEVCLLYTSRCV